MTVGSKKSERSVEIEEVAINVAKNTGIKSALPSRGSNLGEAMMDSHSNLTMPELEEMIPGLLVTEYL